MTTPKTILAMILLTVTAQACMPAYQSWSFAPIVTPSGKQGYTIDCKYDSDCWVIAGRKCPAGYTRIDEQNENGIDVNGNAYGVRARTTHVHHMVIECRSGASDEVIQ